MSEQQTTGAPESISAAIQHARAALQVCWDILPEAAVDGCDCTECGASNQVGAALAALAGVAERIAELERKATCFDWMEKQTVYVYKPDDGALLLYRRPGASSLTYYAEQAIEALEQPRE